LSSPDGVRSLQYIHPCITPPPPLSLTLSLPLSPPHYLLSVYSLSPRPKRQHCRRYCFGKPIRLRSQSCPTGSVTSIYLPLPLSVYISAVSILHTHQTLLYYAVAYLCPENVHNYTTSICVVKQYSAQVVITSCYSFSSVTKLYCCILRIRSVF